MSGQKRLRNIPAFDGFRGVGVSIVILSHLPLVQGSPGFNLLWHANQVTKLGYVLLDVFFALSGFLITRLLLAEREATGRISFSAFYLRRGQRIFPIYYIAIVICYFMFHFSTLSTVTLLTYTFNIYHPFYPAPHALEQSWSLSVEEQFYLVWPLVVSLVPMRLLPLVTGRIVPGLGIGAGMLLGLWAGSDDAMFSGNLVYMSTLTRMLSLSLGGWLAVREFEDMPVKGWKCLALMVAAVAFLALDRMARGHGLVTSQGVYWTMALVSYAMMSVAMIGTVVFDGGIVARIARAALSFRVLRGAGRISYALYLYHIPVLFYFGLNDAVMQGEPAPAGRVVVAVAVIYALAIFSYFAIERPLLARRFGPSRHKPADAAGALGKPVAI